MAALGLLASWATSAQAADDLWSGIYVKGEAGVSLSHDAGRLPHQDQNGIQLNTQNDDLGTSATFGLGIGKQFGEKVRVDFTLNYRTGNEVNTNENLNAGVTTLTADLNSYGLMASAYYDIAKLNVSGRSVIPYVGGGLGIAINELGDSAEMVNGTRVVWEGDRTTNLAWQVGGGVGIELTDLLSLDAGYRYVDMGGFKSGNQLLSGATGQLQQVYEGDFTTHEVMVGLRYSF